jgi:hypothetical protein
LSFRRRRNLITLGSNAYLGFNNRLLKTATEDFFQKPFQLSISSPQEKQKFSTQQKELPKAFGIGRFFVARKLICFSFAGFSFQSGLGELHFKRNKFLVDKT